LAAHARLPLFLALMVPHRVETSACMFWGTLGAPGRVYSQTNRAPSGGMRGAASVPKTTFSLVTLPTFSTVVTPIDIPIALRRRPHRLRRGLPRQPLALPSTFDSPRVLAGLTFGSTRWFPALLALWLPIGPAFVPPVFVFWCGLLCSACLGHRNTNLVRSTNHTEKDTCPDKTRGFALVLCSYLAI